MLDLEKSINFIKANIPPPIPIEDVNDGFRAGTYRHSASELFLPGPIPGRVRARVENKIVAVTHPISAGASDIFLDINSPVSKLDFRVVDGDEIGPLDFCIGLTEIRRDAKSGIEGERKIGGYVVARYTVFNVLDQESQPRANLVYVASMDRVSAEPIVDLAEQVVNLSSQRLNNS